MTANDLKDEPMTDEDDKPEGAENTPSFAEDHLLSLAQVSDLTGFTRHTLRQYSSLWRFGKELGPRPTRLEGKTAVLYRWADVRPFVGRR